VFFLVPAHPGSPGQRAVKLLSLLCCYHNALLRRHAHVFEQCLHTLMEIVLVPLSSAIHGNAKKCSDEDSAGNTISENSIMFFLIQMQ